MRTNRIKHDGEGIYHLISRVVDRDFKLDDEEKDIFVRMMRKAERFSGIDVLTYAVMSNHFHILVRIPDVNPDEISNEELLDRYRVLYGDMRADMLARRWEKIGTDPEKMLRHLTFAQFSAKLYNITSLCSCRKSIYQKFPCLRSNK